LPTLISSVQVKDLLVEWFASSFGSTPPAIRTDVGSRLEAGDSRFQLVDASEIQTLVQQSGAIHDYDAADRYDCEDLAFAARVAVVTDYLVTNPRGGLKIPPAFGFLLTEEHALNVGIETGSVPYLYDARTNQVHRGPIDGSFLNGTVNVGWFSNVRKVRYVFL
jgi:hypothetical protein